MRDKSGRFLKGYSGNAGGRPKDEHNIATLARSYSAEAIETLLDLMRILKRFGRGGLYAFRYRTQRLFG